MELIVEGGCACKFYNTKSTVQFQAYQKQLYFKNQKLRKIKDKERLM